MSIWKIVSKKLCQKIVSKNHVTPPHFMKIGELLVFTSKNSDFQSVWSDCSERQLCL